MGVVRTVERWARRFAIVGALMTFNSDRALALALSTLLFGSIGYGCARYSGRRRLETLGYARSERGWTHHIREHLIGWLIFAFAFTALAEQSHGSVPLLMFGIWSVGFIAGDFVHRRSPEGMREQLLRIAAEGEREEIAEAVRREERHARRFEQYDDYLRDRAALLLTREEFYRARRDYEMNPSREDGPPHEDA